MMILGLIKGIFGTKNDREIKKYLRRVAEINALEPGLEKMDDEAIKNRFEELKRSLRAGEVVEDEILNEVFAIVREVARRTLGMRHFDVQLLGGLVLNEGRIAEMKTGEGKTLVATAPVVLNAMRGEGVHVVTVNDYLAERDASQMGAIYNFLGLSVGVVLSSVNDDAAHRAAYECDITYGTNNEFGFDYLRDNMKFTPADKVQRGHGFVIVDEVDSILIDEARTPLIISGPAKLSIDGYIKANEVASQLRRGRSPAKKGLAEKIEELEKIGEKPSANSGQKPDEAGDFIVDEKNRTILITESGIAKAERAFGVENLYSLDNATLAHQLDQALKAQQLFERDVHYVVRGGELIIVDEFTGRLSEGRRFSEGLHQALEAKEGVKIQEESQTLADITFQNYFRLYKKIAGMTGTAATEASEFHQIYKLDVISVPTHLKINRKDKDDLIYKSQAEKFKAVIEEIKRANSTGQPVLVGTASIERSELLHSLLVREKIPHHVLNAKNHEQEALIIQDAGRKSAVTIATNMAGRGVDIKIDDEVRALGGLYIIGTERHESRRIDNQLRGRAGRQGDPGLSRFFLSLEDNLLRIFGGERIKNIMGHLGVDEGEHIESGLVTRAVAKAQQRVEAMHFESRKQLLEYDDVANEQRKNIYHYRNELLDEDYDLGTKISQNIHEFANQLLSEFQNETEELPETPETSDTPPANSGQDLARLRARILGECGLDLSEAELAGLDLAGSFEGAAQNTLAIALEKNYLAKMSALAEDQRRRLERVIYLQVLDTAWREHLYQMDLLKTGIGLRGYNQKDPLVEYKKESYELFIDLVERIKMDSIKLLLSITLDSTGAAQAYEEAAAQSSANLLQGVVETGADEDNPGQAALIHGASSAGAGRAASSGGEATATKKVPRNSPCPCGSGKKYKDCHGKSGPKIGLFA